VTSENSGQTLVKVCQLSELEEGEIFHAEVAGSGNFAIYLVEDKVYATDNTCTHGAASLAEDGYVENHTVTCSWHDGAFDIRSGEPLALPCMVALKTYPTVVKDGEVHIVM
jgi:nitrite reductase/ring-hydroxylating ferredoxin subunit